MKKLTETSWNRIYANIRTNYLQFPERELRKLYEAFRESNYESFDYFIQYKSEDILNKQAVEFNEYFNF